jgi:hypothetical protein
MYTHRIFPLLCSLYVSAVSHDDGAFSFSLTKTVTTNNDREDDSDESAQVIPTPTNKTGKSGRASARKLRLDGNIGETDFNIQIQREGVALVTHYYMNLYMVSIEATEVASRIALLHACGELAERVLTHLSQISVWTAGIREIAKIVMQNLEELTSPPDSVIVVTHTKTVEVQESETDVTPRRLIQSVRHAAKSSSTSRSTTTKHKSYNLNVKGSFSGLSNLLGKAIEVGSSQGGSDHGSSHAAPVYYTQPASYCSVCQPQNR